VSSCPTWFELLAAGSLTPLALEAFRGQLRLSPCSPYLFPSDENPSGHQRTLKTSWHATLRRAKVAYFRIYDLRSTYATRLSAGGVADEWVTQMLRQGDALGSLRAVVRQNLTY
jgi:integrase